MVAAGLRDADVAEAWSLLRAMSPRSIESARPSPDTTPQREAVRELEEFASTWRRLARVLFAGRDREAYEALLGTTYDGDDPIVWSHEIVRGVGRLSEDARQELERRGLDPAMLERVRAWVDQAIAIAPLDERGGYGVDGDAREHGLWQWYLRWSAIARASIRDGRALQPLGMSSGRPA